jgi:hypothetical protein
MDRFIALAVVSFCTILCTNVYAEEPRPCADEIAKFCKKIKPGEGSIMHCLKGHESKLSALCREKMEEREKRQKDCKNACCDDVKKFCEDVRPGGGRIAKCLRDHVNKLSAPCKERIEGD